MESVIPSLKGSVIIGNLQGSVIPSLKGSVIIGSIKSSVIVGSLRTINY